MKTVTNALSVTNLRPCLGRPTLASPSNSIGPNVTLIDSPHLPPPIPPTARPLPPPPAYHHVTSSNSAGHASSWSLQSSLAPNCINNENKNESLIVTDVCSDAEIATSSSSSVATRIAVAEKSEEKIAESSNEAFQSNYAISSWSSTSSVATRCTFKYRAEIHQALLLKFSFKTAKKAELKPWWISPQDSFTHSHSIRLM